MHEMSIVDALIEQVSKEVGRSGAAGPVTRVDLSIGRLSGVNPDSIRFAFEMLAPGTAVEGATLAIREPKAVCVCRACGKETEIDELTANCPNCSSSDISITGGQQLLLESIEVSE
jgi:hydrogenase nickel incorporation protein HypA/HybF